MQTSMIVTILFICVCAIIIFMIYPKRNEDDEDEIQSLPDKHKHKIKSDKSSTPQRVTASKKSRINGKTTNNNKHKPHHEKMNVNYGKSIKQVRIDLDETDGDVDIDTDIGNDIDQDQNYGLLWKYDIKYPVRIRSALDIIHPDSSGTIEPDQWINNSSQLADTIDKIHSQSKSTTHDKTWKKIVVQEIPLPQQCTEYVISCLNGVMDKLYVINSGRTKEVSLKNLSDQNKKYLRKIIFDQHKKIGTVSGIFELGFVVDSLDKLLENNPDLKFVGITVTLEMSRNIKVSPSKLISYPYNG